jgi:hypothetical protein
MTDIRFFSEEISGKTGKKGRFYHQMKSPRMTGYVWVGTIFERERERERERDLHQIIYIFAHARNIKKIFRKKIKAATCFLQGRLLCLLEEKRRNPKSRNRVGNQFQYKNKNHGYFAQN